MHWQAFTNRPNNHPQPVQMATTTITPKGWITFAAVAYVCLFLVGCFFCNSDTFADQVVVPAPDFSQIHNVAAKKQAFIEYLSPLVAEVNQKVLTERQFLEKMHQWQQQGRWIRSAFLDRLIQLSAKYRENTELLSSHFFENMLRKVDRLPLSLAIAQAATESGWGTSRFARQGHNYFGQWCFVKGCGLVPKARSHNLHHEVARFDSPLMSVESYVLNLNRHHKYQDFRKKRAEMRVDAATSNNLGLQLAAELRHYSERREAYTRDLQSIIQNNDLASLDF